MLFRSGSTIFEPQGTVFREQVRPNEKMVEPLLDAAEEIAWRTRDLANLPVGTCYWLLKSRPYKARRIQVSRPIEPPRDERQVLDSAIALAAEQRKAHGHVDIPAAA